MRRVTELALRVRLLLGHICALLLPGYSPPTFHAHPGIPGELQGWDAIDKQLLIEEGRRQLDRQATDLNRIITRSHFVFTATLALITLSALALPSIFDGNSIWPLFAWLIGLFVLLAGFLATVAVMAVRADFRTIDACNLSHNRSPVVDSLSKSYANAVISGENTIATRLTVSRDALLLILLGGLLQLLAWVAVL